MITLDELIDVAAVCQKTDANTWDDDFFTLPIKARMLDDNKGKKGDEYTCIMCGKVKQQKKYGIQKYCSTTCKNKDPYNRRKSKTTALDLEIELMLRYCDISQNDIADVCLCSASNVARVKKNMVATGKKIKRHPLARYQK